MRSERIQRKPDEVSSKQVHFEVGTFDAIPKELTSLFYLSFHCIPFQQVQTRFDLPLRSQEDEQTIYRHHERSMEQR
jgi:hypothetical protein